MPENYQYQDFDHDWIVLGHLGREPPAAGLRAEPQYFMLGQIEGEEIRIQRFDGALEIEFDHPQCVNLSELIVTGYQKKVRLQNVQIELLGTGGDAPASRSRLPYQSRLRPTDPAIK